MACLLLQPPPINLTSSSPLIFHRNSHNGISILSMQSSSKKRSLQHKTLTIAYALAESNSTESLDQKAQSLLQELANSFALPPDYFSQLPDDLRLDLNDAAFDLANGPVIDECRSSLGGFRAPAARSSPEASVLQIARLVSTCKTISKQNTRQQCGQELGEALLNLSQAWEQADTSTSSSIASKLPSLTFSLSGNAKSALGKRLVSSGRRFQAMGQYGEGELQKIAKVMIETGRLLSSSPATGTDEKSKEETRMFKFGDLQVKLTSDKANIGAAIGVVFGIVSWQLSQGIQSIPESSLQYANDNALLLAKSLRGALLAICYSSAILSGFATVGLILLGRQLKSEEQ